MELELIPTGKGSVNPVQLRCEENANSTQKDHQLPSEIDPANKIIDPINWINYSLLRPVLSLTDP